MTAAERLALVHGLLNVPVVGEDGEPLGVCAVITREQARRLLGFAHPKLDAAGWPTRDAPTVHDA